jgi:hypothetical protein
MDTKPAPVFSKTSLAVLALSYAIALPWLIWGEAVNLAPLLCALVFGYCLIRPCTLGFQCASNLVKALVVALTTAAIAAIVFTFAGVHEKPLLMLLRGMPQWLANHFFFAFFALLPLAKGIAVGGIQLITHMMNAKSRHP